MNTHHSPTLPPPILPSKQVSAHPKTVSLPAKERPRLAEESGTVRHTDTTALAPPVDPPPQPAKQLTQGNLLALDTNWTHSKIWLDTEFQ